MYHDIQKRVQKKCQELGRAEPKLIAVSKLQPNERVEDVLKQGHKVFGENRVQEAQSKWPEFREKYSNIELHLLGPLQTNKVNAAMPLFDCIHSLDRLKLAEKIATASQTAGQTPQIFIQVNTGAEPQKAGILSEDLPSFLHEIKPLDLNVIGLMCIPPADSDPRPHFKTLRTLAEVHGLTKLSMGMSGDFEIAIEEGATHIRVGSAIFGSRNY